jgi:LmbE family N-acetylglucosaminyl deacetylase
MQILAIGAHPDDIELGAGGALAKHAKKGDKIHILVMSSGERGGSATQRTKEAKQAAKILGASNIEVHKLPDAKITDDVETIMKIENIVNQIHPQRVYTHSSKDTHQDHRYTALASISAARYAPEILAYESPLTFPSFNPQVYIDITDTLKIKVKALMTYKSQVQKEYMKAEAIEGLARYRGHQAGVKYAEAFEVIRMIMK